MWVYVDIAGRVTAFNPNDMTGNTGWEEAAETVSEPLVEEHDVPIYKYDDGHVVHRTQEEIEADIPVPDPDPEIDDTELLNILMGGAV